MWCDTFDADLVKLFPELPAELGERANVKLWTYSHETDGKINSPVAWNTRDGLTSFFWTERPEHRSEGLWRTFGEGFTCREPLLECTWLEVLRDEWVHGARVVVNETLVWVPPESLSMKLMYDLRGWHKFSDDNRGRMRASAKASVLEATRGLERALEAQRRAEGAGAA